MAISFVIMVFFLSFRNEPRQLFFLLIDKEEEEESGGGGTQVSMRQSALDLLCQCRCH
jgi:hypothetical protein